MIIVDFGTQTLFTGVSLPLITTVKRVADMVAWLAKVHSVNELLMTKQVKTWLGDSLLAVLLINESFPKL